MESLFNVYFKLGLEHIADIKAYDHIVFIIALTAIYLIKEWKEVAILVTAFTIGHSITLALSVLNIFSLPKDFIETLIPITILLTCVYNLLLHDRSKSQKGSIRLNYAMALFFGFIHGMGFSNYLKSLLGEGNEILKPLFAFNLGIEVGQLLIVFVILIVSYIVMDKLKVAQKSWIQFVSGLASGIAITLML